MLSATPPRIQIYYAIRPQNDIAGGSRERPSDLHLYRSDLNALTKDIALGHSREPPI